MAYIGNYRLVWLNLGSTGKRAAKMKLGRSKISEIRFIL